MLKALIFDFDGLMLDTETPEYEALNEVYHELGQHLDVETYGSVVGAQYGAAFEPLAHLQALTGKAPAPQPFWERVDRRRLEIVEASPLLPGVERLIRAAKARGLKLAIASSSPHAWVEGHLRRRGVFEAFDVIRCREDVSEVKPSPALFLAALRGLGVRAEQTVVFEDSPNGVLAARRAGIFVVAVPNPVTEHLDIRSADLCLKSLAEVSLEALETAKSAVQP